MKSPLENLAIIIVALLSFAIIGFIIWYNMMNETIEYNIPTVHYTQTKEAKASQTKDYLANMENYEDKDVESDKVNTKNTNAIKVHSKRSDLHTEEDSINSKQADFINDVSSALESLVDEE